MSIELFAKELKRFLSSVAPEVLCITGKWGVGKTYIWNHYLSEAQKTKIIGLDKYAYVSLFGRNSLDDVRNAIVENTVDSRVVGLKPDITSYESIAAQLKSRAKSVAWLASFFPGATGYVASANRALFLLAKEQIICIDDLERVGAGLDVMNVLGLVSTLRQEKSCKVVILLNDDALTDKNKKDFKAQLEKVADTILAFEPTPVEAAEIAIEKSTNFHERLGRDTRSLNIVNIRVIKKIEALCARANEFLASNDPRVLEQAVDTITLAGYAKLQPDDAPPLELIKTFNSLADLMSRGKNKEEDSQALQKKRLNDYGFTDFDKFDAVIVDGVEKGFFDEVAFRREATELQRSIEATDRNNAFQKAWDRFHGSFDNDQEAVLDALADAVRTNYDAISPGNLAGTLALLRESGREQQAKDLLKHYIDHRKEDPEFWDLSRAMLAINVTDPEVQAAFQAKHRAMLPQPDLFKILERLSSRSGWSPDEVAYLAERDEAEFFELFKRLRDADLRSALIGGLMFRDIGNPDEKMKTVTRKVEAALKKIALESPMNAKRVRAVGINI